jgi:hypothetical protein
MNGAVAHLLYPSFVKKTLLLYNMLQQSDNLFYLLIKYHQKSKQNKCGSNIAIMGDSVKNFLKQFFLYKKSYSFLASNSAILPPIAHILFLIYCIGHKSFFWDSRLTVKKTIIFCCLVSIAFAAKARYTIPGRLWQLLLN